MTFTLVLPVKETPRAKSRLRLEDDERRDVMRTFIHHALEVAASSELASTVVIVGSLELVPAHREVAHVPEPAQGGLNAAVDAARSWANRWRPDHRIAVLPVDLPCLTPAELDSALDEASVVRRAFVPDHLGSGTTLVTACSPDELVTAYGPDSARRHRELGLDVLSSGPGLRFDVDLPADLDVWVRGHISAS